MKTETGKFIRLLGQTPDVAHWWAPGSSRRPVLNYRATTGQNAQTVLNPTDKSTTHPPMAKGHGTSWKYCKGQRTKTGCLLYDNFFYT